MDEHATSKTPQDMRVHLSTPHPDKSESGSDEMLEKLRDPNFLPSHDDILAAFGKCEIPRHGPAYDRWEKFCNDENTPVFEFLNKEFINAFSEYLQSRANALGGRIEEPITILEVAAGNGRFSHFLRQRLDEVGYGNLQIIATDSGAYGIKPDFEVEQLDYRDALEKYKPEIVICSWMPYLTDFTSDFVRQSSVQEYILVGEAFNGCCGDPVLTWGTGYRSIQDLPPDLPEPFRYLDELEDISQYQLCKIDSPGCDQRHSTTVSFKRKNEKSEWSF